MCADRQAGRVQDGTWRETEREGGTQRTEPESNILLSTTINALTLQWEWRVFTHPPGSGTRGTLLRFNSHIQHNRQVALWSPVPATVWAVDPPDHSSGHFCSSDPLYSMNRIQSIIYYHLVGGIGHHGANAINISTLSNKMLNQRLLNS